jgi:hypothetical protein
VGANNNNVDFMRITNIVTGTSTITVDRTADFIPTDSIGCRIGITQGALANSDDIYYVKSDHRVTFKTCVDTTGTCAKGLIKADDAAPNDVESLKNDVTDEAVTLHAAETALFTAGKFYQLDGEILFLKEIVDTSIMTMMRNVQNIPGRPSSMKAHVKATAPNTNAWLELEFPSHCATLGTMVTKTHGDIDNTDGFGVGVNTDDGTIEIIKVGTGTSFTAGTYYYLEGEVIFVEKVVGDVLSVKRNIQTVPCLPSKQVIQVTSATHWYPVVMPGRVCAKLGTVVTAADGNIADTVGFGTGDGVMADADDGAKTKIKVHDASSFSAGTYYFLEGEVILVNKADAVTEVLDVGRKKPIVPGLQSMLVAQATTATLWYPITFPQVMSTDGKDYQIDANALKGGVDTYIAGALGDMLEDVNRASYRVEDGNTGTGATPIVDIMGAADGTTFFASPWGKGGNVSGLPDIPSLLE